MYGFSVGVFAVSVCSRRDDVAVVVVFTPHIGRVSRIFCEDFLIVCQLYTLYNKQLSLREVEESWKKLNDTNALFFGVGTYCWNFHL